MIKEQKEMIMENAIGDKLLSPQEAAALAEAKR